MRKLMLFTLGFAAMALILVQCFQGVALTLPLLLLLPMAVLFFFKGKPRAVAIVLLGAVLGGLFTSAYTQTAFRGAEDICGKERSVTLCVEGYPKSTRYGFYVEVSVLSPSVPLRAVLYYSDDTAIAPGDTLNCKAVFEKSFQEDDADLYYPSKGVGYTASLKGEFTVTAAEKLTLSHTLARFSHTLQEKIYAFFPASSAGYFTALVTGDRSGLSYTFRNAMSLCGLYHAVSLSGMHVSILMAVILLLCSHRRRLAGLLGVPILILFVLLSGSNPATIRAVTMQGILLLGVFFQREYDPLTALSAALMLLLLQNPWSIAQWGLQLSFLSTAGILVLCPALIRPYYAHRPRKKLLRYVTDFFVTGLAVTVSATVFTLPLMVLYFGLISVAAPITNLLCLWSVTWSFVGGIITALTALFSPCVAMWLAGWLHLLYVYLEWVVSFFASLPLTAVYTSQPFLVIWSVLFYLAIIALFLLGRRWKLTLLCTALSFALCLGLTALTTQKDGFAVLSVGQGQSIALSKGEDSYLIDCGGSSEKSGETAARYLLAHGHRRIDAVVLTHFDSDHTVGLLHFLTRVEVQRLYYSAETAMTPQVEELLQSVQALGVETLAVEETALPLMEGELHLFSTVQGENDNDNGLCLLADTAKCDILITGDLSAEGELRLMERYRLPQVDIFVAGHHGSKNSSSLALLQSLRPDTVLISVGKNSYGHPANDTLRRIAQVGAVAYTTLDNGNLIVRW